LGSSAPLLKRGKYTYGEDRPPNEQDQKRQETQTATGKDRLDTPGGSGATRIAKTPILALKKWAVRNSLADLNFYTSGKGLPGKKAMIGIFWS
jgi:hypothetical protein